MNESDPRYKLISLVENEINSGASKDAVVEKLMLCGMKKEEATYLVQSLSGIKSNYYKEVSRFFFIALFSSVLAFTLFYKSLGSEVVVELTWVIFASFLLCFIAGLGLMNFYGKVFAWARTIFLTIAVLLSIILSFTFFLHPEWEPMPETSRPHWRSYAFRSIIQFFHMIGPTGFGIFFALLSLAVILLCWGEWHKLHHKNYGSL